LDRTAQVDTAKAGLDEAKHTWREKVADAFSQLANSHLSNNGSIDQYINNAVQTTQQVISELCKAN
jgi:outer membrane protein TolC